MQRGGTAEIPLWPIMAKRLVLTGSTLRGRGAAFKAQLADELRREVWPRLGAGGVAPVLAATFPLADAASAHKLMESGEHVGKIVLTV
jgi:NADPH:quinone reductase-like Zn-dependent oxidoreductase